MSKKLVFPLVAVVSIGIAAGSMGCRAEAKIGNAEPKAATPPPPPPPPDPPPPQEPAIKTMGKAKLEGDDIKIPGNIQFEIDKATIKNDRETQEVLKALLEIMKENPAITKLQIQGHTDDKGGSAHNHVLSQKRAEAVAAWLAENGVDRSRMVTVGFGEEKPMTPNSSDEARRQNRRTEFKVWEIEGKPTNAANDPANTPKNPLGADGSAKKH